MNGAVLGRLAVLLADGKNQAGGEVAVNVRAPQRGDRLAVIDVAAGNAHAIAVAGKSGFLLDSSVVRVLDHRVDPVALGRAILLKFVERLTDVPAIVTALCDEVDLLPFVLPDVRRPEVAGLPVEAHAPDIAQAISPNLPAGTILSPGKRVVRPRFGVDEDVCTGDLEKLLASSDVVIHLAAITDAAGSFDNQEEIEKVNFDGTRRLAEACVATGCKLIFLSTTSVYGVQEGEVDETCPVDQLKPQSPYADSKLRSEFLLQEMGSLYLGEMVVLALVLH